jgi:hypothetical protein
MGMTARSFEAGAGRDLAYYRASPGSSFGYRSLAKLDLAVDREVQVHHLARQGHPGCNDFVTVELSASDSVPDDFFYFALRGEIDVLQKLTYRGFQFFVVHDTSLNFERRRSGTRTAHIYGYVWHRKAIEKSAGLASCDSLMNNNQNLRACSSAALSMIHVFRYLSLQFYCTARS